MMVGMHTHCASIEMLKGLHSTRALETSRYEQIHNMERIRLERPAIRYLMDLG